MKLTMALPKIKRKAGRTAWVYGPSGKTEISPTCKIPSLIGRSPNWNKPGH